MRWFISKLVKFSSIKNLIVCVHSLGGRCSSGKKGRLVWQMEPLAGFWLNLFLNFLNLTSNLHKCTQENKNLGLWHSFLLKTDCPNKTDKSNLMNLKHKISEALLPTSADGKERFVFVLVNTYKTICLKGSRETNTWGKINSKRGCTLSEF